MKNFQVQRIDYVFDKYKRTIWNEPHWYYYKSYKTLEGAIDAITAFRTQSLDKAYYDYPGADAESKYPHLKPIISIFRYRIKPLKHNA